MTKQPPHNTPRALDAIADVVLAYKKKAKIKAARERKKKTELQSPSSKKTKISDQKHKSEN